MGQLYEPPSAALRAEKRHRIEGAFAMTFISKALMYIVSVAAVGVLFASIMGMTMWLVLTIFRFVASEFSRMRSSPN
jgi:hypothetical protein